MPAAPRHMPRYCKNLNKKNPSLPTTARLDRGLHRSTVSSASPWGGGSTTAAGGAWDLCLDKALSLF